MAWNPQPTVTVKGVDYTNKAIVGTQITYGRTTTNTQPRAGYATISLADFTNQDVSFNIGDAVTVKMKNTSNVDVTVFTGTISDITTTVISSNPTVGTYLKRDIIATGPLGKLNRRLAGSTGYASQNDGTRIATIINETYAATWNSVPATQTWATTTPTLTWATYDPLIGVIDQPGLYALAAYSSGAANALSLTSSAANDGLGVLYDTPGGAINYDAANHRQNTYLASGYWNIPNTAVVSAAITQSAHLGDVANTVKLDYSGGTVTRTDATSVATYGPITTSISTNLANVTDATAQADRYLKLVAYPTPQFDSLTLAIHQPTLDNATINAALNVYNGEPIQVSGLPNAVGPTFSGFVEGWTWRIGQYTADLKLIVSDFADSVITTQWQNATPTLTWATTTATTKWQEAIVI